MKKITASILFICLIISGYSFEKRDFLQKKSKEIGLENVLVKDFSEIQFPTFKNRDFWIKLPAGIKNQYIKEAEEAVDYDWPVVKATDYLEIIRSGDRRQEVYTAPRAKLLALVMGELIEGKRRFMDQIVNGVWYYCEQTWWVGRHTSLYRKLPMAFPMPMSR